MLIELEAPAGIENEGTALLESIEKIVLVHVGRFVTGYIVGFVDEIGFNGLLPESEMRDRHAAGFSNRRRSILRIEFRVVADDLYGIFVRTDRSVGTETPELAAWCSPSGVDLVFDFQDVLVTSSMIPMVK